MLNADEVPRSCRYKGSKFVSRKQLSGQLEEAARLVGYANSTRYRARAEFLFRGIKLSGAQVLDVGCGTGAWSIWAALQDADRVVGIEPEAAGSNPNTLLSFTPFWLYSPIMRLFGSGLMARFQIGKGLY